MEGDAEDSVGVAQYRPELPASLGIEESRRAVMAGCQHHAPIGAERQHADFSGVLAKLV
jgi:hypothetical protein